MFGITGAWAFLLTLCSVGPDGGVMVEGAIGQRVGGGMKVPTVVKKSGKMRRGKDGVMMDKVVEMIAGGPTGECWTTSPAPTLGECGMPLQCSGEGQECMVRLKQDERGGVWLLNVSASGLEPRGGWDRYHRDSCNEFTTHVQNSLSNTTVTSVINSVFISNICNILNKQSLPNTNNNPCQSDDCASVKVWKIFKEGIPAVQRALEKVWRETQVWFDTSYYSYYPALCAIYKRVGSPVEYLNNLIGTDLSETSMHELKAKLNDNNISSEWLNITQPYDDSVYYYHDQKLFIFNCTNFKQ